MKQLGIHPVLTARAMRSADEFAMTDFGLPGFTLMELAGRGAAEALIQRIRPNASVAVYCGKGNNGGDGFVIARYLHRRIASVRVFFLGAPDAMSEDAAAHFALLRALAREDGNGRLTLERLDTLMELPASDVHVDALLGTGQTSELREPIRSLVERLNNAPGLKIAVDVPTGLHTDIGRPLGVAFRADATYTMGALKTGLIINDGPSTSGGTRVIDIGIPNFALRRLFECGDTGCAGMATDEVVRRWMPERGGDANKYSVGLALVVAGSPGMTGAPAMAATAAARAGAGYVVCGCDERIERTLNTKLTEVTTVSLPALRGGIDPDKALESLADRLEKASSLVVGCGLGRAETTEMFVRQLLEHVELPTVVDADALHALIDHTDLIRRRAEGRWILTPHMGEFQRLADDEMAGLDIHPDDRVALAQHFARTWNCVLVLKGLPSIVACPDGRAWINGTGGPALASAGTGDVLAGICAGLLAQGLSTEHAAVAALHLGGAAADRYGHGRSERSLQAMDLVDELPYVMKERLRE